MRKKILAANWKMYKTPDQAREYFRDFLPLVHDHGRDEIVVCPTYLAIDAAITAAKGSNAVSGTERCRSHLWCGLPCQAMPILKD